MRGGVAALCAFMFAAIFAPVLAPAPAAAHHSLTVYDSAVVETLSGTVVEFDWSNPHVHIRISPPDAGSHNQPLEFEGGDVGRLTRLGWHGDAFAAGEEVTVTYNPMRDGSGGGHFLEITNSKGEAYSLIRFRTNDLPVRDAVP
jgi:hypothetical protein